MLVSLFVAPQTERVENYYPGVYEQEFWVEGRIPQKSHERRNIVGVGLF